MVVRPSSSQSNNAVKATDEEMDLIMSDPFKYVSDHVKRKIRNLEKRKEKLDGYKAKMAKGDKLNKDQHDAIAKYGEVTGMLTFATEMTSHLSGLENSVKKERKKRARREQIKHQQDKMDLMTRAIETLTLMHLPEAQDEPTVSPLREQTFFHPNPGAHLSECASGTAKLLVGIFDDDKIDQEVFATDNGSVTFKQVRDTLDAIRPKYNPVPEFEADEGTTPDDVIEHVETTKEGEAQEDELFENGGDTEVSSPVVINEEDVPQLEEDEDYVDVSKEDIEAEPEVVVDFQQPTQDQENHIPETIEFVNREVYGEEEQIKEILVEVSSGFNFLAPADEAIIEEQPVENTQVLSFGQFHYNSTVQGYAEPEEQFQAQAETISYENYAQPQEQLRESPPTLPQQGELPQMSHHQETVDMSSPPPTEEQKDDLTWQQKQTQPKFRGQSNGANYSYKNSQRYQRSFQDRRNDSSGEGDNQRSTNQRVNGGQRGGHPQYRRGRGQPPKQ